MALSIPRLFSRYPVLRTFLTIGVLCFAPQAAFSQTGSSLDAIVISADRFGIEAGKIGSASTIISREQIENSGAVYAQDLLRKVPGFAVNRSGSFGNLTQARVRGAEGNHVVVVIDGIEVNNPTQGEFDFSNLLADDIERIEVLRGPQSASWGSNALAGVINIVTKNASRGVSVSAKAEAGSFNTRLFSGSIAAGNDRARAVISLTNQKTDGINESDFGSERDGDDNTTFSLKADADATQFLNVSGALRYTKRNFDFDRQDFDFPATPTQGLTLDSDRETKREELFLRGDATLTLLDERWMQKAFITHADTESDSFSDQVRSSGDKGERLNYGYQSILKFSTPRLANANHSLIGLVEKETERFRNTGPSITPAQAEQFERNQKSFVGEYRLELWDSLFTTASYRYDDNDKFEDAETYRFTAAYLLRQSGTRLHGSYGKGITNPTFTEQFGFFPDSFDGNPDLVPEESIGWDIGVEQALFGDMLTVDVTYFKADLKNEIVSTFDGTTFRSSVDNLTEDSRREGVEVSLTARPTNQIDVYGSYTYTDSVEIRDGVERQEVRRPEHVASLDITYRFLNDRAQVTGGLTYNGDMEDLEFIFSTPETRVKLDKYALVRLSGSYDISDSVRWFGRIENLFDEDYEEVFGFNTPGFAAYTGIRMKIGD